MSQITTHVLDASLGVPAAQVAIVLERWTGDSWTLVATGETDSDGRARELGPDSVESGRYRLTFASGDYFGKSGRDTFYPEVTIVFAVAAGEHYHVPILLSPFAYTTYRGS